MSYLSQNAKTGRIVLPDLVRAFALFGIVVVNVAYFAFPGDLSYHAGGLHTVFDKLAYLLVDSLFLLKSYTLFSFMFGVGLAYQMLSAQRHNESFGLQYFRRMLGLLVLGALHVTLAFVGDILMVYAVLGCILFLFRNASLKTLVRCGIAFIVLQILISALFTAAIAAFEFFDQQGFDAMMQEAFANTEVSKDIFTNASFYEIAARRWHEWLAYIVFATPLQAPGVIGFFLLGLAAVRSGILSDHSAAIWGIARRIYLPIGLVLSVGGAYLSVAASSPMVTQSMLGMTLMVIGAPFASMGYIGVLAKWSAGSITPLRTFVARAGTASLTAYLLQSLILSLVFCSYGLGLYGQLGALQCILIAVVVGIISITFSSLWRTRFKRGPMEALLRSWTYLGQRDKKT